jgi:hypothetical protein
MGDPDRQGAVAVEAQVEGTIGRVSPRPVLARVIAAVAVVLVLAATGVASYRMRDADPRPALLQSDGSMTLSPAVVNPGQLLRARFTASRRRYGGLSLTSPAGSYLLADGRLVRIPPSGLVTITFASSTLRPRLSAAPITSRIPATLPPGRYRVCALDELDAGPSIAECAPLTVLG